MLRASLPCVVSMQVVLRREQASRPASSCRCTWGCKYARKQLDTWLDLCQDCCRRWHLELMRCRWAGPSCTALRWMVSKALKLY